MQHYLYVRSVLMHQIINFVPFQNVLYSRNICNIKKISTQVRSIPDIEQGIFFNKRIYFSVGGIGKFGTSPFKELSKRFYSRIDPQNPLPALIIRSKNFNIF